jgi:hypothetical protein
LRSVGTLKLKRSASLPVTATRPSAGLEALYGFDDAHLLERIAADRRAVVAGDAAAVLEQLIAGEFLLVQGLAVTLEPFVEARVRRDQGFLEGGDGLGDLLDVDLVGAEGFPEFGDVTRDRLQTSMASAWVKAISPGLAIGPPAWALRSAARPSQNCATLRLELRTVGALIGPSCQLWPIEVLMLSVPPIDRLWHELQEMKPDLDRRGSK